MKKVIIILIAAGAIIATAIFFDIAKFGAREITLSTLASGVPDGKYFVTAYVNTTDPGLCYNGGCEPGGLTVSYAGYGEDATLHFRVKRNAVWKKISPILKTGKLYRFYITASFASQAGNPAAVFEVLDASAINPHNK